MGGETGAGEVQAIKKSTTQSGGEIGKAETAIDEDKVFDRSLHVIIGLSAFLVAMSFILVMAQAQTILWAGIVSMIVLFGVLIVVIYLHRDFNEGEIRKAITLSLMVLFFYLVAIGQGITITEGTILDKVLTNYWVVLTSVIAFYFGGRSLENYAKEKKVG